MASVRKLNPYVRLPIPQMIERIRGDVGTTAKGCIEWPYGRDPDGYGVCHGASHYRRAHRAVYWAVNGTIPDGLVVRHTCDNPPCINPKHLIIGTCQDNTLDSVERGRNNHGERHHFTPFTEADIRRIRASHAAGQSIRSLARETGVAKNAIANIVHRNSWKHVA